MPYKSIILAINAKIKTTICLFLHANLLEGFEATNAANVREALQQSSSSLHTSSMGLMSPPLLLVTKAWESL